MKKTGTVLGGCAASLLAIAAFLTFLTEPAGTRAELKQYLREHLTKTRPISEYAFCASGDRAGMLYVLGGSQESLQAKLVVAANLYHRGVSTKIVVFSNPGITEFDPLLGRNLKNDEWVIKKLTTRGVRITDIDLVHIGRGIFGTLTEARAVTGIAAERGCRRMILVTSSHHSKRTWMSFSKFLQGSGIDLYLYSSTENTQLVGLLLECAKLVLYKTILLLY